MQSWTVSPDEPIDLVLSILPFFLLGLTTRQSWVSAIPAAYFGWLPFGLLLLLLSLSRALSAEIGLPAGLEMEDFLRLLPLP